MLTSTIEDYYPNGSIKNKFTKINGVIDGPYKTFYDDGQIRCEGNFHKGFIHGEYKEFDPDGSMFLHCFYHHGVKHGQCLWLNSDGSIRNNFVIIGQESYDASKMSGQEKMILTLKHDVKWLTK